MARLMYEGKTLEFKIGGTAYWRTNKGFLYDFPTGRKEPMGAMWTCHCRIKQEPKPKFNLKPFDRVLARHRNYAWVADIYSHRRRDNTIPWVCVGETWPYIAPYEGNEHYLGTTDDIPGSWGPEGADE